MDDEGAILREDWKPPLGDDEALDAYRRMLFARTADAMSVSYQRQGRMYTYPPNFGQEAIAGAFGRAMRPEDWLVPAFRELGAWLQKGARMRDIFLLWMGVEEGNRMSDAPRMLPPSVPIASQLLHAAGIGKAMRYRKEQAAVFAFVGDGGTSTGDFHEALNFAAVWDAPVVFIIQNNQYAISVPLRMQTRAETLAGKAGGFGLPGLQVDGNDFFALSTVALAARQHALEKGPVLVEALTYRRGAHTTSDDPSKYRSAEEEKAWETRDPLRRLRLYLEAPGALERAGGAGGRGGLPEGDRPRVPGGGSPSRLRARGRLQARLPGDAGGPEAPAGGIREVPELEGALSMAHHDNGAGGPGAPWRPSSPRTTGWSSTGRTWAWRGGVFRATQELQKRFGPERGVRHAPRRIRPHRNRPSACAPRACGPWSRSSSRASSGRASTSSWPMSPATTTAARAATPCPW